MKKLVLFGALIFALSGCTSMGGGEAMAPADAESAKAAIAAAEASVAKAKKAANLWRDTEKKYLGKAKAALKKKDYKQAIKLANKAKEEGDMAAAQAMTEKNAGPWLF